MANFTHIAIIGRRNSPHLLEHVTRLANFLQQTGCVVYVDSNLADEIDCSACKIGELSQWVSLIDLAIIVGGDGTMLSAGRELVNHNIPIIGVNQGRLGFMTDIAIDDMLSVIQEILIKRNYIHEERSLLSAQVIRCGKFVYQSLALNDIVISRGAIGSMIEFEMSINNEFVHSQKSDGVIFSTPTGSTAYSLAAGGPILHPCSNVFSIVPICPQSMSNRPLVISDNLIIELILVKDTPTIIHYDGQDYFDLQLGDQIIITKAKRPLKLLHPGSYNYYRTLRTKLDWAKRVS